LLHRAAELKGAPLTEEQVLHVRDAAVAVVTPSDVVEAERGYPEVDRADPRRSWQREEVG
jgi:hypothetical protein